MAQISVQKQFSLNVKDALKGLLLAVGTPVLATIYQSLQKGSLTFDWNVIGVTAGSAAVMYLLKNYFTPTQTVITKQAEDEKPVVQGTTVIQPEIKSVK